MVIACFLRRICMIVAAVAVFATALTSCGRSDSAFPCKIAGDERWSLVDGDGNIIGRNLFASCPTLASEGRFWARNAAGYWELYALGDCANPVNDREYCGVSEFFEGRAFVTPRDGSVTVIDADGRDCLTLDSVAGLHPESVIPVGQGVAVFVAGKLRGAVNVKGEVIEQPSERKLESYYADSTGLAYSCDGNTIFSDSAGMCGVRNAAGEIIVKPRYRFLRFLDRYHLKAAPEGLTAADGSPLYIILNLEEMKLREGPFCDVSSLLGDNLFVATRPGRWRMMSPAGYYAENMPSITELRYLPPLFEPLRSDRVDISGMLDELGLTPDGVCGLTFSSTPQQAVERERFLSGESRSIAPSDYSETDEINIFPHLDGETASVTVSFPQAIASPKYSTREVTDKILGIFPTTRTETVAEGFAFNALTPESFTLRINNYGRLRGKLRAVLSAVASRFEAAGAKKTASNAGAVSLSLSGGRSAMVTLTPHAVVVSWGYLSEQQRQIDSYAGAVEETGLIENE